MKQIPISLILALVLMLSFGTFASANTSQDSIIRCSHPHDSSAISDGMDIQVSAITVYATPPADLSLPYSEN